MSFTVHRWIVRFYRNSSDRAIRFQAEDLDESVAQAVDASSYGGESDIVSLASGHDRYLS